MSGSTARSAGRRIKSLSRGFSHSTILMEPARGARASETPSTSIWIGLFRIRAKRWPTAPSIPGPSRATGRWLWRCERLRESQGDSARCSLSRSDRSATRGHPERRAEGRFPRREGILRLARAQEIQVARARFSQPLSRLRLVPGLQWHAAATGSASCEDRGQLDHRGMRVDGERSARIFSEPSTYGRRTPRLRTRCWRRFSSGCAFSMKWASIT